MKLEQKLAAQILERPKAIEKGFEKLLDTRSLESAKHAFTEIFDQISLDLCDKLGVVPRLEELRVKCNDNVALHAAFLKARAAYISHAAQISEWGRDILNLEPIVVIDDLHHGYGIFIIDGFSTTEEAVRWGERWQEIEGDCPLWNMLLVDRREKVTNRGLLWPNSDPALYARRIYRTADYGASRLNLIGPFPSAESMDGYMTRDASARRSHEWQSIDFSLGRIARVDHKQVDAIHRQDRYLTEQPGSKRDGLSFLTLTHPPLRTTESSPIF